MKPNLVLEQLLYQVEGSAKFSVFVSKIGRKYFTVQRYGGNEWETTEYNISDWSEHTYHMITSTLYSSEQEYLETQEEYKLCDAIRKSFEYGGNSKNVSLENLRKIAELIHSTTMLVN